MMRWLIAVARALAVVAAGGAWAEPMILGVGTHFGFWPPKSDVGLFRSWMARARFDSARDDMFWVHVEDGAGRFELRQGATVTRDLWRSMRQPFEPLLVLGYGHPAYDGGGQPRTPAARAAFARYAGYVLAQTAPSVRMVEVWNEWNLKAGARPGGSDGDAQDYARLADETAQRLKALDPAVKVLVGAVSDDFPDWRWMRRGIAAGLLAHADGVSVHLYNYCMAPQRVGADELIERLDALRAIMDAAGRPAMPVYVSEVGWPTHSGKCPVGEADAATHSVRFMLQASERPWVKGVWFYEFQDGGEDPADREAHFGLLRRDGSEKPAGCALRELAAQIARRPTAVSRSGAITMARFVDGAAQRWILWASAGADGDTTGRLTGRAETLRGLKPTAVCGLASGTLTPQPDGRSAAVTLARGAIVVIDLPAGQSLALEDAP